MEEIAQLHHQIQSRIPIVAALLFQSPSSIEELLPHLASDTPYTIHPVSSSSIVNNIDHTLLKPIATVKDIAALCDEAVQHQFKAVCVNGSRVGVAVKEIKKHYSEGNVSKINHHAPVVAAVIGFPLGSSTTASKAAEAKDVILHGAKEVDMVINLGWIKDTNYTKVITDIQSVVLAASEATVKVILETCLLNDDEIIDACLLACLAGAHYVKTSTGFSSSGATLHHVLLMRLTVGSKMGVKASGGIRSFQDAEAFLKAGATRLGTSSGVAIKKGIVNEGGTSNY